MLRLCIPAPPWKPRSCCPPRDVLDRENALICRVVSSGYPALALWGPAWSGRRRHGPIARGATCAAFECRGRDYAYLLGLYLGDGCTSPRAAPRCLRVCGSACADAWPGLIDAAAVAMAGSSGVARSITVQRVGCNVRRRHVQALAVLVPATRPGRKHNRKIELAEWQRAITRRYPDQLARGLFHSDGCRFTNRVRRPLKDGDKWYEYPRYMFTNESADILGICGEALDQLGVDWRFSRRNTISVARRDAVARLDQFVGPSTERAQY